MMAFGARQETDGTWRLCLRKGRTITGTNVDGQRVDFRFKGQRQAKACADDLNENFWPRYKKHEWDSDSPDWAIDMVDCIRKHSL